MLGLAALALLLGGAGGARAGLILFTANETGLQEVPPTGSSATGFASVVLDDVAMTITVNESWSGLAASATASHIHGPAAPGTNAGVLFPFSGVPAATAGSIPQQVFAITPAQILDLKANLYYANVHDSTFPGGEIRGQLINQGPVASVPEPSTLALLALGGLSVAGWRRWKGKPAMA
jgi:hypothetical protein